MTMKLSDITSEGDLRQWMKDYAHICDGRLKFDWIEPSIFGSSVGQPDLQIKSAGKKVGLELKYLLSTKKGIKWTLRPAQRRYHHMNLRNGGCSAVLAFIPATKQLLLMRGDHVPLRDYASDPNSGCANGRAIYEDVNYFGVDPDNNAMFVLERLLFHNDFWE
jgi:hypothetical protein